MCSVLTVSHTTSPTPTGLRRDRWEYILRHLNRTPGHIRGDLNPVQGPGQHLWGGSGFTHSSVVFTLSVCTHEFTLIPSLSSLMGRVVGFTPGQHLVPGDGTAPTNVTGWV